MPSRGKERLLLFIAFLYTLTGGLVLYLKEPNQAGLLVGVGALMLWAGLSVLSLLWQKRGSGFDQYITPVISFLSGTGLIFLCRLQPAYGYRQVVWLMLGLV